MPFLVYLGAGLIFKPGGFRIRASRTLSTDRAIEGSTISVRVEVINEGGRLDEISFHDLLPKPLETTAGSNTLLTPLEPGETFGWEYTLSPDRGYYRFDRLLATARDSSGLFTRQEALPVDNRLMILPNFIKLKPFAIRPRRTRGYSGFIPSKTGGQGIEFFGVREYQQGDSPRLINWKATARHPHAFFTNEFELERVTDVGLILDVRWRCYFRRKEEELFERAVSAAAALAETFLNSGNRVGMFIYGRVMDWTFPGYGNLQKERIFQALAKARISEDLVFDKLEYLPTRLFPSHSQLIFISPLVRDDIKTFLRIRARGYQVLVVSPDPVGFEGESLKSNPDYELGHRIASIERTLMLREFQRFGIGILNWPVNIPLNYITGSRFTRRARWQR